MQRCIELTNYQPSEIIELESEWDWLTDSLLGDILIGTLGVK